MLIGLMACAVVLSGCVGGKPSPGGEDAADQLAAALSEGSIDDLPLAGDQQRALLDYEQTTGALDGLLPTVEVASVDYGDSGDQASVQLNQSYQFGEQQWSFTSTAQMSYNEDQWQVEWTPSIVHPELGDNTRLYDERTTPKRGSIIGADGLAIVEDRPVYKVGIDKTQAEESEIDSSARALAKLVEIDEDPYAEQVAASGPQAFVPAVTLREGQVPPEIEAIPGAVAIPGTLPLAPSSTFARGILGTVGEATAEDIENSDGTIAAGDLVGQSGLQQIHDAELRGEQGHAISIIARSEDQLEEIGPAPSANADSAASGSAEQSDSTSPSSDASPDASDTASPDTPGSSSSGSPSETSSTTPSETSGSETADTDPTSSAPAEKLLFSVAPTDGTSLQLTMDADLQRTAESVLSGYSDNLVLLAVLDKSSGAVLAAAESPAAEGQSFSTTGGYPPGSTMKIATSLALIRQGYTADSAVSCTPTATVNGREFNNWPGYPAAFTGDIPLRDAVAQSCNAAFINAAAQISDEQFAGAAASLGMGADYDSGFGAFYGSVPATGDPVEHAAGMIGQGQVLMSPMALASEAASVANGHTTIAYLIQDEQPTSSAQELTADEAAQLSDLMQAVVARGTGTQMQGVLDAAKTGTAEFGEGSEHSWIVGWNDRYAIAAMSYNGDGADKQAVIDFMNG